MLSSKPLFCFSVAGLLRIEVATTALTLPEQAVHVGIAHHNTEDDGTKISICTCRFCNPIGFTPQKSNPLYAIQDKQKNNTMPVKHIVMFTLQDGVSSESIQALKDGLLSLPKVLPPTGINITEYELGEDLLLEGGQNHPSGIKNRSIVWSVTCPTVEDYISYEKSQQHIDVIQNQIKPIIVPGSRAAIQYEI
jgi:Stress responsive A/B Barrel Domain